MPLPTKDKHVNAQIEKYWHAWCENCEEGAPHGTSKRAAKEWADEHNNEWHPEPEKSK